MSRHLRSRRRIAVIQTSVEFAFEEYDNASIVAFHVLDPTDPDTVPRPR